jgi:urease accessory protein UreE
MEGGGNFSVKKSEKERRKKRRKRRKRRKFRDQQMRLKERNLQGIGSLIVSEEKKEMKRNQVRN